MDSCIMLQSNQLINSLRNIRAEIRPKKKGIKKIMGIAIYEKYLCHV